MASADRSAEAAIREFTTKPGSGDSPGMRAFKLGLEALRNNIPGTALVHFREACALESQNPYFLSYAGLALARTEQDYDEAERYCIAALQMKRSQAQLYLNLTEVYMKQGKRADAVDTLQEGLVNTHGDEKLSRAFAKLGVRRPPVLTFVARSHPINVALGRLRHRTLRMFAAR